MLERHNFTRRAALAAFSTFATGLIAKAAEPIAVSKPVTPDAKASAAAPIGKNPAVEQVGETELDALRGKLHAVLDRYYARKQHIDRVSPWQALHWVVAFGTDTYLHRGGAEPDVTAIGWLCWNGRLKGQGILYLDGQGRLGVLRGPGVQGHDGQMLAYLSQSRMKSDYPLRVNGKSFTLVDLIELEKRTCEPGTELTFKLMGLAHYLKPDATWQDEQGRPWSIERLVREELAQNVIGAACGGTHRLMGLTVAVKRAASLDRPLDGEFARADKFLRDYQRYTWSLQNDDGSFSTEYFRRRSNSGTNERKLETSGHTLEWLAYSLGDGELKTQRCFRATNFVTDLLAAEPDRDWPMGPLGHGLHALVLYENRVFSQWKPKRDAAAAPSS